MGQGTFRFVAFCTGKNDTTVFAFEQLVRLQLQKEGMCTSVNRRLVLMVVTFRRRRCIGNKMVVADIVAPTSKLYKRLSA